MNDDFLKEIGEEEMVELEALPAFEDEGDIEHGSILAPVDEMEVLNEVKADERDEIRAVIEDEKGELMRALRGLNMRVAEVETRLAELVARLEALEKKS